MASDRAYNLLKKSEKGPLTEYQRFLSGMEEIFRKGADALLTEKF